MGSLTLALGVVVGEKRGGYVSAGRFCDQRSLTVSAQRVERLCQSQQENSTCDVCPCQADEGDLVVVLAKGLSPFASGGISIPRAHVENQKPNLKPPAPTGSSYTQLLQVSLATLTSPSPSR